MSLDVVIPSGAGPEEPEPELADGVPGDELPDEMEEEEEDDDATP